MPNKHGLSRNIPANVKREVRQSCQFGCVRCRASLYQYDHFDPEFVDAKEHIADGIALLCPTCHDLKTKGVLTPARVKELKQACRKKAPRPSMQLPEFEGVPCAQFGGGIGFFDVSIPVRYKELPILSFLPPEEGSRVTRITAELRGSDGESLLRIVDNEWIVQDGAWDYEWVGRRLTIRDASKRRALQIRLDPPKLLAFEYLRTRICGVEIAANPSEVRIGRNLLGEMIIRGFPVGLQIGRPLVEVTAGMQFDENGFDLGMKLTNIELVSG